MQRTALDRWLRSRFTLETHIRTLRLPEELPPKARITDLPDQPGARFRHLFVFRNPREADSFVSHLRDSNMMFSTDVVDRKDWFVPLISPQNRSFTWRLVWIAIGMAAVAMLVKGVLWFAARPDIRKMFQEIRESAF
jgi:hypothetical protein